MKAPTRYCNTTGKVMFDKRGAQSAANYRFDRDRVILRIYACHYCNSWHLTSRVARNSHDKRHKIPINYKPPKDDRYEDEE